MHFTGPQRGASSLKKTENLKHSRRALRTEEKVVKRAGWGARSGVFVLVTRRLWSASTPFFGG